MSSQNGNTMTIMVQVPHQFAMVLHGYLVRHPYNEVARIVDELS